MRFLFFCLGMVLITVGIRAAYGGLIRNEPSFGLEVVFGDEAIIGLVGMAVMLAGIGITLFSIPRRYR
jgi:hypothetical protein